MTNWDEVFTISLGPKNHDGVGFKSLHHEADHVCEIYVDFAGGSKMSLGTISVIYDYMSGKLYYVALIFAGPNGENIWPEDHHDGLYEGIGGRYKTVKAALKDATTVLCRYLTDEEEDAAA